MKDFSHKFPIKLIYKEILKGLKVGFLYPSYLFYRHLVKTWNTERLYWDLKESENDFKEGRYKRLNSVRDLM